MYKGFLGAGNKIPTEGGVFAALRNHDKTPESADIIRTYIELGFKIYASPNTGAYLKTQGIEPEIIEYSAVKGKIGEEIQIIINPPKAINLIGEDTFPIRRAAIERGFPVLTCMDTARIFTKAIKLKKEGAEIEVNPL